MCGRLRGSETSAEGEAASDPSEEAGEVGDGEVAVEAEAGGLFFVWEEGSACPDDDGDGGGGEADDDDDDDDEEEEEEEEAERGHVDTDARALLTETGGRATAVGGAKKELDLDLDLEVERGLVGFAVFALDLAVGPLRLQLGCGAEGGMLLMVFVFVVVVVALCVSCSADFFLLGSGAVADVLAGSARGLRAGNNDSILRSDIFRYSKRTPALSGTLLHTPLNTPQLFSDLQRLMTKLALIKFQIILDSYTRQRAVGSIKFTTVAFFLQQVFFFHFPTTTIAGPKLYVMTHHTDYTVVIIMTDSTVITVS